MYFQAHVFVALSQICVSLLTQRQKAQNHHSQQQQQSSTPLTASDDVEDLLDKILHVMEVALSNVLHVSREEHVLLMESSIQLITAAFALSLSYQLPLLLTNRLYLQWKSIQVLVNEGLSFVTYNAKLSTFLQLNLQGIALIARADRQYQFLADLQGTVLHLCINVSSLALFSCHHVNAVLDFFQTAIASHRFDHVRN
jgi:hypothetical protein